jgi:phosphoribosyl-ATP pyrophosphohydrolase/phosphoribosyl-AMP cyclohydrolase/histidinol dehydrogenase
MIIPTLSADRATEEKINDWSLFGKLAIRGIESSHVTDLEKTIKRVGGGVDLILETGDLPEEDCLKLLNVGGSLILRDVSAANDFETIPSDRTVGILAIDTPDQAIPENHLVQLTDASADRMAELEMARVDCLVEVEFLVENTEVIVNFFEKVLVSDRPDGLWSTVIVDPLGVALGLAYSNAESLSHAIENRVGTYYSRSRDGLWIKGETSGATQQLLGIRFDCDRDCLQFRVTQSAPGFCHRDTYTCFGDYRSIQTVMHRLIERINDSDPKSFTRKLANDAAMLETKLLEEAKELSEAGQADDQYEIAWEAADVLYFSLVAMLKNGVTLDRVFDELARRMTRVVRRKNKLEQP